MPKKKKTPMKPKLKDNEHPEPKMMPAEIRKELSNKDLESVTGGVASTGLQNPLDPPNTIQY